MHLKGTSNYDRDVFVLHDRLKAAKRMTFLHVSVDGAVALEAGAAAAWKEQIDAAARSQSSASWVQGDKFVVASG